MENLLTVSDMAKVLKKSEDAVRTLRQRGVLPSVIKVGRSIYWRERDIREMLEKVEKSEISKGEK